MVIYSNILEYQFLCFKLGLALWEWLLLSPRVSLVVSIFVVQLWGHGLHDLR